MIFSGGESALLFDCFVVLCDFSIINFLIKVRNAAFTTIWSILNSYRAVKGKHLCLLNRILNNCYYHFVVFLIHLFFLLVYNNKGAEKRFKKPRYYRKLSVHLPIKNQLINLLYLYTDIEMNSVQRFSLYFLLYFTLCLSICYFYFNEKQNKSNGRNTFHCLWNK